MSSADIEDNVRMVREAVGEVVNQLSLLVLDSVKVKCSPLLSFDNNCFIFLCCFYILSMT